MDNQGYIALTRQSGLLREMQVVANNIANISTTGYKSEGVMFSEYIKATGVDNPSISMATGNVRRIVTEQGALSQTNGTFDVAVEGDGYFLIETPEGEHLTRAGHFTPDANGDLVNMDGLRVLDAGGAPIFIPPGDGPVGISPDGTISRDGLPIGQIGVVMPNDPIGLRREGGNRFSTADGWEQVENPRMLQGFLENSNVNAIQEMARMIEIQRAYELGQSFMDKEDERMSKVLDVLGK